MKIADTTAESVADHLRIPLVTLDVRAMSGKPSEVEAAVSSTLQLAEKWNAVALIDEADVLFEQRSPSDLARNGLVSGTFKPMASTCRP